jgi:hypothetical protein
VADNACEQQGFHLGTPAYGSCRAQIAYRQDIVGAAMQAQLQRNAVSWAQMNRMQTCSYTGQSNGGISSGMMTCN